MRVGPSVVAITLQTNHSTYSVGDTVRIRVLLKNPTSVQYAVLRAAPWRIVKMVLRRSDGTTVAPANNPGGHDWLMPVSIPLLPGQVQPLYNYDRTEWSNLKEWGYLPLPPGSYELTGTLSTIVNVMADLGTDHQSETDRYLTGGPGSSASVSFTIVDK